jgi:hypothetical protein
MFERGLNPPKSPFAKKGDSIKRVRNPLFYTNSSPVKNSMNYFQCPDAGEGRVRQAPAAIKYRQNLHHANQSKPESDIIFRWTPER